MSKPLTQIEKLQRYNELIRKQTGKVVRPARFDGYKNLLNKYGTSKDTTEHYFYAQETDVNDDQLTILYEGNGLFSKIIDAPAEEAVKHGFELKDLADQDIEAFYSDALDELDWEESAITAVKWARLFGGSIIVMLINDGRGIDEPLDWKNIRSIDDMRVYERAIIQPDYTSMFHYEHEDPFRTRGSRLGMPERFYVTSRWGSFCVHESRCLVFQNGVLPENTSNSIYQIWGVPEYFRLKRALRDAEVAHGTATKLLDRSVQAVYKMKNLAEELATEEGEDRVLRRLQTIDMARGLLNSITIDAEGEEYDFRQFSYSGVSEVIDTTCNFLSALTSIPQTILFGRSPAGMNATGESDLENWYNYVERLQKRMLRSNLRYLLAIIFQAGVNAGDIDEVPDIKVQFSPLWSMSDMEQADLDLKKVQIQQTRAGIAVQYIQAEVLDPTEVRKKLADSEEFDIETMLDEYTDDELFPEDMMQGGEEEQDPMAAMMAQMGGGNQAVTETNPAEGDNPSQQVEKPSDSQTATPQKELNPTVDIQERNTPEDTNAPASEPAATKLPQDKSAEEQKTAEENTKEYFKSIDLSRYDDFDEEPASWITVNGNRIPLNEAGDVIGGQPKAFGGEGPIGTKAKQKYTSSETSINSSKVPAVFSKVKWKSGTTNIDIGGGKFDTAAEYLEPKGVKNLVYDPYNRSKEHNDKVIAQIGKQKADTATISNVLNVIEEKEARLEVLQNAKRSIKPGGECYVTVYEGNGSGTGKPTSKGYQLNRKLKDYLPEIREVFPNAKVKGGMIVASYDINADEADEIDQPYHADDKADSKRNGVGVYVIQGGKVLVGRRMTDVGYGEVCGPGGHIHVGETPKQAAMRETEEEFGIVPKDLMYIGKGTVDAYGVRPYLFLCTEYEGSIQCKDHEMSNPRFVSLGSLKNANLFDPFESGIAKVVSAITGREDK